MPPRDQSGGDRGREDDAASPREQRGDAASPRGPRPPTIDLYPAGSPHPDARRVASDILSKESRAEPDIRSQAAPAAAAAEPLQPAARSASRLRDLFTRSGSERVRDSIFTGPLDRSVRAMSRCPPGLVKTGRCAAPGNSRSATGQRESLVGTAYSPQLFGLTGFGSGRYLYRDGYLLQLARGASGGSSARDGIAGYIPLLGGALASGNIWPGSYGTRIVPAYLVDFYNLGEPGSYRYADNTLYRVDPESAAIRSVAALLTDKEIVVGSALPGGYDVYNVPYPYRDRYAETDDAAYRYADGYVYRINPDNRMVVEAIDLLT